MVRGIPHGKPFRKLTPEGPWKRLDILKSLVNALIMNERIESTFPKAYETQKYMDRLITIAKYGEEDKYCRDMVDFWVTTPECKRKLFDVLLPRYENHLKNFTRVAMLPREKSADQKVGRHAVLELKGNPLPPLPLKEPNPHSLQNVLINAAKNEWFNQREEKI